jgi:ribosomal protein S18 acetylase RimI-like enzyme
MLAVPATIANDRASGARPIDISRDSGQILSLLDQAFGPLPSGRGQRMLISPAGSNFGSVLGPRFSDFFGGVVPGFVWEEAGRIVGTLSLLAARKTGKFLVANVAIHPDYRRRGIATRLMIASMDYMRKQGGREILLQVERDNEAANRLYADLHFSVLGEVNNWTASTIGIRSIAPSSSEGFNIRSMSHGDEKAAYLLDQRCMPFTLRWPDPPHPAKYRQSLWRRISDFFNGKKMEVWVADTPAPKPGKRRLVGLGYIESEWARPHELAIRVIDEWQGRIERNMVSDLVAHVKQHRSGHVRINHLASDGYVNDLLKEANFRVKRSLRLMHYSLSEDN